MDSSFLQIVERQVELALLAIDLGDANVGLRVFRIRIRDHFVLFESGIGLAVAEQVLRQAANGIEIVAIEFNRMPVGFDGFLVLLLLLVGVAERGIELGRASVVRHRTQHFGGASACRPVRCRDRPAW